MSLRIQTTGPVRSIYFVSSRIHNTMGSSLFRGKKVQETDKHGQIFVDTDQKGYSQGSQVRGTIYIKLSTPLKGVSLSLRVKGTEIVQFVESESRDSHTQ